MKQLNIISMSIEDITPNPKNARKHSVKQLKQLENSIQAFGNNTPITIDEKRKILCGHARFETLKRLGHTQIPTVGIEHLNEAQKRAFMIADNKIAENATWDEELLSLELEYLTQLEVDVDVNLTGFSMGEIDVLLGAAEQSVAEEPPPPPPEPENTVTMLDDVWQLGPHRILCGDCRDNDVMESLMDSRLAQMVITDPPYNVPINGHVSGLGKNKHDEFAMATGEMTYAEFIEFLFDALLQMDRACVEGALQYVFMDWRHQFELLIARQQLQNPLVNLCVWVKTNGGMGSLYRSQHELIFIFKKGSAPHINNVELGTHGRYRTNVWTYPGVNTFGEGRDEALASHPTVKPVAMVADAILDVTHRGNIVLDGFLGSGTTLLAAEQTGRVCYGVEIDPRYVDVSLQRWMVASGDDAVHLQSGHTFDDLRLLRADPEMCEV